MSERGTYVTSCLYDYRIGPVLQPLLERITRRGTLLVARYSPFPDGSDPRNGMPLFMAGMQHGGYPGEEAFEAIVWAREEVLPALHDDHGQFSITVTPEHEAASIVLIFHLKTLSVLKVATLSDD